jgi:E3 ubiquitin-protein ligase HUWE1
MLDNTKNNPPLVISRKNILEETFNQFLTNQDLNLYRKIQIHFVDEMAYDDGGVEREWYSALFKEIFSEKNNYFREIKEKSDGKGTYFISNVIEDKNEKNRELYFSFFGKLFAKAILDKILIPYELNPIILKYLLFSNYNHNNIEDVEEELNIYNLNDVKNLDYEIYNSLQKLLITDLDNNNDIFFVWNVNKTQIELIDDGENTLVNNKNKNLFINKIVELVCYESIKTELNSFKNGFISIIPLNFIKIFTIEEFNFILSGQTEINLKDWKLNTIYKGDITEKNEVIQMFWEVLQELNNEQLLLFFKFCTGSTRVPVDGFSALPGPKNKIIKFSIELKSDKGEKKKDLKLITAQTCFNNIILPEYKTKEEMRKAINIILESDTNYFGLE